MPNDTDSAGINAAGVESRPTGRLDLLLKANSRRNKTKKPGRGPVRGSVARRQGQGPSIPGSRIPAAAPEPKPEPDEHEREFQQDESGPWDGEGGEGEPGEYEEPAEDGDEDGNGDTDAGDTNGDESKDHGERPTHPTPIELPPSGAPGDIPPRFDQNSVQPKYAVSGLDHRSDPDPDRDPDPDNLPGVISIALPAPVRAKYASQRSRPNQPLRDYLAERLTRCQDHTAAKPLYIGDRVRRQLEGLANRNFDSAEELLGWVMSSVMPFVTKTRGEDIPIHVELDLVERVEARKDVDVSLSDALSEYLAAGIEIKTGMR